VIALLHGAPAFGAVETYVVEILGGLRQRGEAAVVFYPDVPDLAPLAEAGVHTEPFRAELLGSAPRLVAHLRRRLRALRPRVVHVTDIWPPALVATRLARVPRVLVTHHTPELPRHDNLAGRTWWRLGWLTRPEVIYTSESDRDTDTRTNLRTHVVYYGIDLDRFANAAPALERNGRVIGNVARLAPQKGQRFLIDAAPKVLERYPDARFVVVGEGELREDLGRRAEHAGLADRFLFTGPRDDVPELLASMDVFALPSLFEGLCYAVIEAQAAGVPVVATPVGGVRENVVPGETGVIVPPEDPGALADAIVRLLDEPEEARRLAENARRRTFERYSLRRKVAETIALYG
jgi:glycosyltransferase involved in cell wall biosynthesis